MLFTIAALYVVLPAVLTALAVAMAYALEFCPIEDESTLEYVAIANKRIAQAAFYLALYRSTGRVVYQNIATVFFRSAMKYNTLANDVGISHQPKPLRSFAGCG